VKNATPEQEAYIKKTGIDPKSDDQILTMNYAIEGCKAWGKSLDQWLYNGFNNHMYSQVKDKRKQKLLELNMEYQACN